MRETRRALARGAVVFLAAVVLGGTATGCAREARAQAAGGGHGRSAEAGAHGEGDHGIDVLALLFYVANFTIFVVALGLLARKPLGDLLRERRSGVLKGMEEAAAERARAEALLEEVERRLARMDEESRSILERAESEARAERERMLAEARAAAERLRKLAEFTIDQERKKAVLAVREEAAGLALELAEAILREKMGEEDDRRVLREFLEHPRGEA